MASIFAEQRLAGHKILACRQEGHLNFSLALVGAEVEVPYRLAFARGRLGWLERRLRCPTQRLPPSDLLNGFGDDLGVHVAELDQVFPFTGRLGARAALNDEHLLEVFLLEIDLGLGRRSDGGATEVKVVFVETLCELLLQRAFTHT